MTRWWIGVLLLLPLLFSCNPNSGKSLKKLEKLQGNWVSIGNTKIFFKWGKIEDKLEGFSYSLQKTDTLFLNSFELAASEDSIFLFLSSPGKKQHREMYYLKSSWFGEYVFESEKDCYPFRITIDLKSSTLWIYRQENIRGNQVIKFKMKRL